MQESDIVQSVNIPREWVILWRWNHFHVLKEYALEIVNQSKLLVQFLDKLKKEGDRVALIIDSDSGERLTFKLDGPGGMEYQRMLKYLKDLQQLPARGFPNSQSSISATEISKLAEEGHKAFSKAIEAALVIYESKKAIQRLILISSGPRWVNYWNDYYSKSYNIAPDLSVTDLGEAIYLVDPDYAAKMNEEQKGYGSAEYWPGVNLY